MFKSLRRFLCFFHDWTVTDPAPRLGTVRICTRCWTEQAFHGDHWGSTWWLDDWSSEK